MISENVWSFCVLDLIGRDQDLTLRILSGAVSDLLQTSIDRNDVGEIESRVQTALALVYRDYPVALQVIYKKNL